MDLFADFSFSKPSSLRHSTSSGADVSPFDEELSPRSSRGPSPFSSGSTSSACTSMTDLPYTAILNSSCESMSQDRPYPPPAPLATRLPGLEKKRRQARDYFDTIRERRQSAIRLQCDPKRAASIRTYVERLLLDNEGPRCISRHPSSAASFGRELPLPPTSAPLDSFGPASDEGDSADEGADAMEALTLGERTSSSGRPSTAGRTAARRRSYAVTKSSKGRVKSMASRH